MSFLPLSKGAAKIFKAGWLRFWGRGYKSNLSINWLGALSQVIPHLHPYVLTSRAGDQAETTFQGFCEDSVSISVLSTAPGSIRKLSSLREINSSYY